MTDPEFRTSDPFESNSRTSEPSRRDTLRLAAAAGFAVTFVGAGPSPVQAQTAAPAPAPSAAAAPQRVTLTLLHVNDIYKMSEEKGRGGFARLAGVVKAERAKGGPMLFTHAGDCFSPSLMSGFDQGAHIVELHNVAPPDVFVPGNHEFDFGKEAYLKRVAESRFPYFAANLRGPNAATLPRHQDRRIFDLGGIKVGVVGLALAMTPNVSSPEDLAFAPEIETLRAQARSLREEGADLIVCVAHTDFATDLAIARSRLVDVLLSGHDHDLRVVYDGRAVMVESGEEGQFVTAVDIACDVATRDGRREVTWRPNFRVIDSATVAPDPDALAIVQKYEGELSKELDVTVGQTRVALDSRSASVRSQETVIGNLIADAIRLSTGADMAITNGGGIRGNKQYPAGTTLTRRDILTELPFGNATVMVEITGADVKAALENGASQFENRAGRFPQVSGLSVTYDMSQPVGSRVVDLKAGGQPVDPSARYRVASNNFMLSGGDGYVPLGRGRALIGPNDGKLMANEVMAHVRRLGTVEGLIEGRIVIR